MSEAQKALWNTLADFVRQHPAKEVLDAMSDAFLIASDEMTGTEGERMADIGFALERYALKLVCAESAREVVA